MSKDAVNVGMPEEPLRFTHTSIANAGENITCRQWIQADDYDALRAHCETLHSERDGARESVRADVLEEAAQSCDERAAALRLMNKEAGSGNFDDARFIGGLAIEAEKRAAAIRALKSPLAPRQGES